MKKTFTDEQIVSILRGFEASGLTIKEYCRQNSVMVITGLFSFPDKSDNLFIGINLFHKFLPKLIFQYRKKLANQLAQFYGFRSGEQRKTRHRCGITNGAGQVYTRIVFKLRVNEVSMHILTLWQVGY